MTVSTETVRVKRTDNGMDFTHSCGGYLSVVQGSTATFRCDQCQETWTVRQWPTIVRGLHHFSRSGNSTYRVQQRDVEVRFVRFLGREDARDATAESKSEFVRS